MALYIWIIICAVSLYVFNLCLRKLKVSKYAEKHVFITGCDSGFGNMLAKRLDGLGFTVYAGYLTEAGHRSIRTECSERTVPVQIDVTSDVSIEKAVEVVKRRLPNNGGLWAVINNAGVLGGVGPTGWQTRRDYDDVMAVNLYGVIFVTKAFTPLVVPTKGRIVNMSSTCGRIAFLSAPYTVSKYGVEAFSDILRLEMMAFGVKVVIIEPGFFNTTLLDDEKYREAAKKKVDSLPSEIRRATPDKFVERMINAMSWTKQKLASDDTFKVVDAYVDAVTARYPAPRYLVGNDVNYIYRVLWNLPEWMGDLLKIIWLMR